MRLKPEVSRNADQRTLSGDLVIAGGGLAGTCTAITAAREGLKVILAQDRSVLGGNSSSEVRLWALGATSHMGNNNRWAREGGVVDEIMTENLWRNPEGNPFLFDAVLLDKVWEEPRITLLLDTAVHNVVMDGRKIKGLEAYNSQESIVYLINAPLFCDATGDGTVAYQAGASFRIGAEEAEEFSEPLAPNEDYGELLGSTIYFYSKDVGKPVSFVPPNFALKDISSIPGFKRIKATEHGCSFWWLEYGGRLDTIGDTSLIRKELLKIVYGIWNYIKNSGNFPEAGNLTLEWVGSIPGKRESRRFEGDYMLSQSDIVRQKTFADAVSYGGWAIDLHPADGVYSDKPPCSQYHSRGVYQIPYRCLYSRDIPNLFLVGRLISASHIAFGSTRVMMTGAHNGQAVAVAAAICKEQSMLPENLATNPELRTLQNRLIRSGQFIPHLELTDSEDLAAEAAFEVSDTLVLQEVPDSGETHAVLEPEGVLLPFQKGEIPEFQITVDAESDLNVSVQLRRSDYYGNFSPDIVIEETVIPVTRGLSQPLNIAFETVLENPEYLTVVVLPVSGLRIHESRAELPGILRLRHSSNPKVATSSKQSPPEGSGIDPMEFWLPERRPGASLWAMRFSTPMRIYSAERLHGGYQRPFIGANCWAVEYHEGNPEYIKLRWQRKQKLSRLMLALDSDHDHPMESVQLGHGSRVSPFLPRALLIKDDCENVLASFTDIHNSRIDLKLKKPVLTSSISIEIQEAWGEVVSVFQISAYQ